jgi:hypothetical protein
VYQTGVRIHSTLAGLQALAQMVAGHAGRKNLLWLSGDFPIAFGPNFDLAFTPSTHIARDASHSFYVDELPKTSALLSSSQISRSMPAT